MVPTSLAAQEIWTPTLCCCLNGRTREPVAARLVHYYPGFEYRISDEAITSHRQFRVAVTAATYCAMDAKGFVIERAFDPEAIDKIQGSLPCFVIRH